MLSHNAFAYCNNAPINYADGNGTEAYNPSVSGFSLPAINWVAVGAIVTRYSWLGPIGAFLATLFTPATTASGELEGRARAIYDTAEGLGAIAGSHEVGQCESAALAMAKYLRKKKEDFAIAIMTFSGLCDLNNVMSLTGRF